MTAPIATAEHAPARRFTIRTGHAASARRDARRRRRQLLALLRARDERRAAALRRPRLDPKPVQTITLDPRVNRTFHFWHVYVRGLTPGHALRLPRRRPAGPPRRGHRFNPNKVLIDPYATGHTTDALGPRRRLPARTTTSPHRCAASSSTSTDYDWEGDQPLNRPMAETIIYEMHVGGFTKSPTSGVDEPGHVRRRHREDPVPQGAGRHGGRAAAGLRVRRAPRSAARARPTGQQLQNYWGYSTVGFFAPHAGYCVAPGEGGHIREFRDMVKALHKAGIEVILDVVFNHTGEGNHQGPTISFKGLDNTIYYHLCPTTGSTTWTTRAAATRSTATTRSSEKFILDCLQYWVREMHVDGFRFDEGSILLAAARTARRWTYPPVIWHIELSRGAGRHQDHRRGLGRRRPLPGRLLPRLPLGGVERPLPRRRPPLRQGRRRARRRRSPRGSPAAPTSTRRAATCRSTASTSSLPRRLHAQRPRLLQREAQRGQRRGQPRRHRRQPELELRRRGRDRRPGVEALRERQIKNFADDPDALAGRADVRRRRRGPPHPARQQQRLLPGQRAQLVRLDAAPRSTPTCSASSSEMIAFRKRHPTLHRSRFFTGEVNERGLADISLARLPARSRRAGTTPSRGCSPSRWAAWSGAGRPTPTSTS